MNFIEKKYFLFQQFFPPLGSGLKPPNNYYIQMKTLLDKTVKAYPLEAGETIFIIPQFYLIRIQIVAHMVDIINFQDILMPEGTYNFSRVFTEDQKEMDSIHGIYEGERRNIHFTPDHTFKYEYHYYYEYENSYYVMVDQVSNDTVFTGSYTVEGNIIIATITGGQQKARDEVKKKFLGNYSNIAGTIVFQDDGDSVKVTSFELNPSKLDRKENIIGINFVYRKQT